MPSPKKRSGLGRGLSALVSEAEYETGGSSATATSETSLEFTSMKLNFVS